MRDFHYKKYKAESLYDYEPWKITEEEFKVEHNHHNESIFALGNGYMGLRGTLEEDYSGPKDTTTPGFYINGIYGSERIIYGEEAPRQPERTQTIVNLADWTSINLYIDGEKLDILSGKIVDYKRVLNMKEGHLKRSFFWISPNGRKMKITITRLISLKHQHNAVIKFDIKPLNFSDKARLISKIDGAVKNHHHFRKNKVVETLDRGFSGDKGYLMQYTESTDLSINLAVNHKISENYEGDYFIEESTGPETLVYEYKFDLEKGKEFSIEKFVSIHTSLDITRERLINLSFNNLDKVYNLGYDKLKEEQKLFLEKYWEDVDVIVDGDPGLQQALRFNAFHLLQSTGRDGFSNVPAKGLTGEFYEGHYFWDTETYIIPFYLYNRPELAKKLLVYRYNILDKARINANRVKLDGALYPWRTINGYEASGFFMGSTVQYHIDADIAYAIYQYVTATGDYQFLYKAGAEILAETARMWYSLGSYIDLKDGAFCFNEVCGPDEYKPGVNNNCYNNYMAKFNLEYAVNIIKEMQEEVPDLYAELKKKVDLNESELFDWEKAAANVYLPYNEKLGINPQDDSFIYKNPINIDDIPDEELPLVKNWHPLTIWRYQVIKQADVILLMLLLGNEFSLEQKQANYDYYEPKTTHDSSLSPAVYSIIASEIGYYEDAYDYFTQIARLDLDDYNENTYQGVHTAGMGSAWMTMVYGFAGMRNYKGVLHFNPYLPEQWDRYKFTIKFKGREILLEINEEGTHYTLLKGEDLTIIHLNEELTLSKEKDITASLKK
ncbi:MAG: glycoside hydrolase family 65 protein [Bacillota bacterium]